MHNAQNPLQADAIIVDEFSMVDSFILFSLLQALADDTQLIIIGDKDQLPSVGPGNVLRDMIQSDYFHTIYLNRNFRQNQDSLIVENAFRVNSGEPLLFPAPDPRARLRVPAGARGSPGAGEGGAHRPLLPGRIPVQFPRPAGPGAHVPRRGRASTASTGWSRKSSTPSRSC